MPRYFIAIIFFLPFCVTAQLNNAFVKTDGLKFIIDQKPYYYIGTNYWYGGLLALQQDPQSGKERLRKELDFLKENGITNLRILAGAEGTGIINGVNRVVPPLQKKQGEYNEDVLKGLDFLLVEMGKRDMKAVLYLSNNWEWSGGFLQYLNWNGLISDAVLKEKPSWDELRDQVSRFYSCDPCKAAYKKQVEYILKHTNSYSGIAYINDPTIMSWEIANEPRPMRPSAIPYYKAWLSATASLVKSLDRNHLLTLGTEGIIGTENDSSLYTAIHSDKNVDYLTIHIWPKNWAWYKDTSMAGGMQEVIQKTDEYINKHERIAIGLQKPLVIEEFGMPRDGQSYSLNSTTASRDYYYKFILNCFYKSMFNKGPIAGINFWAFAGTARPKPGQVFWKEGDDYMGDPPQEEQGLNAVFDTDQSTWELIRKYLLKIK